MSSSSDFQSIFDAAFKAYKKKTKKDLSTHPLATQLQSCDSPSAILAVLHGQVEELEESRSGDERLKRWLNPTINVLYAFSAALGEGVGLAFSPAKVIFAGIGVFLLAAKDVGASQEVLGDLFERIENFFKRLEAYTEVPPTAGMTDIIVKIMVEVLSIFAIATKEIKQSQTKLYLKKLVGRTDMEDSLKRLDKLTQEEARMATAETLKITHIVDGKVTDIGNQVKGVDDKVKDVGQDVKGVSEEVKGVGDNVKVVIQDGREAKAIIQQTANTLNQVKRNQLRKDLQKWLSPPDPSTNHNIASEAQHKGTAQWFFQGTIFNEWKSTGSLLWIHGKPGSGKSILCSAIIQDVLALREAGLASVAYFYFDFRDLDKQHRHNLLPSLLIQLSARSDPFCDILFRAYVAHEDGAQKPSDSVLMECLKQMLTLPDQGPVYIIMDALDECPNTSGIPTAREKVLQMVKELVDLRLPNLRICVTSRPEIDIRANLEPLAFHPVSLHEQSGQKKDIVDYVRSIVYSTSETMMKRWRDEDKNLVIETLSEKADGMFRWVFCQLETLRDCLPPSVRRTLRELPESLDETYERVLRQIRKANRDHAHRLLQCLATAIRPLRVQELAEVLALDFDASQGEIPKLNPSWRWEDEQEAVLSICSSLIAIVNDDGSQVVQFSHFSVKEFLMSNRLAGSTGDVSCYHVPLEASHMALSQACLATLLQLDDRVEYSADETFPLARYAAQYWVDHAQFENIWSRLKDGIRSIFDLDRPHFSAWRRIYDIDESYQIYEFSFIMDDEEPSVVPLYYASLCGFHELVIQLIKEHPQHVNAKCGHCGTPLGAALVKKHFQIAQLLLDNGAEMNIRDNQKFTLLCEASRVGRLDIVEWTLTHGADVNAVDEDGYTSLHQASRFGHTKILEVLLGHNPDINPRDRHGRTPLHRASSGGYLDTMRLLLESGADPNARDDNGLTPLHNASISGKLEATRFLLEHGADSGVKDNQGRTPLVSALIDLRHEVAQLLSEHSSQHGV